MIPFVPRGPYDDGDEERRARQRRERARQRREGMVSQGGSSMDTVSFSSTADGWKIPQSFSCGSFDAPLGLSTPDEAVKESGRGFGGTYKNPNTKFSFEKPCQSCKNWKKAVIVFGVWIAFLIYVIIVQQGGK